MLLIIHLSSSLWFSPVFTARCYASMVYAVVVCLSVSVRLCVYLSHASIVSKWLNLGSCKQCHCHMIAQGL